MQLDKDLTLTKAITMAWQSEEIKRQQTDLRGEMSASKAAMDAVHINRGKQHKYKIKEQTQGQPKTKHTQNVVNHPFQHFSSAKSAECGKQGHYGNICTT